MTKTAKQALICALLLCCTSSLYAAQQEVDGRAATVRRVSVLGGGDQLALEIATSQPVTPQTQVVTGPDRLVLDFPESLPAESLRSFTVNQGNLKAIRIGLYSNNPPVTRIVLDLVTPANFQLLPSGKTVIVKLAGNNSAPAAVAARPALVHVSAALTPTASPQAAGPPPKFQVNYLNGRLSIWADKANLAEVLFEVHRKTGADIPIPAGAQQDQVVASIGPASPRDALAALLNGSRFNFIMVGSDNDPSKLKSVILTLRGQEGVSQPAISATSAPESQPETEAQPLPPPPDSEAQPAPPPDAVQPDSGPPPQGVPQQDSPPQ
jgi:AMIN domain-containing protein